MFLSINSYAGDFPRFKSGDFLQKSAIGKDKVLIHDKNYKTKGYKMRTIGISIKKTSASASIVNNIWN